MLCEKKSIALKTQGIEDSETWLILDNRIKMSVASEHWKMSGKNCQVHGEIILPQQPQQPQQVSLKHHKNCIM